MHNLFHRFINDLWPIDWYPHHAFCQNVVSKAPLSRCSEVCRRRGAEMTFFSGQGLVKVTRVMAGPRWIHWDAGQNMDDCCRVMHDRWLVGRLEKQLKPLRILKRWGRNPESQAFPVCVPSSNRLTYCSFYQGFPELLLVSPGFPQDPFFFQQSLLMKWFIVDLLSNNKMWGEGLKPSFFLRDCGGGVTVS